MFNSIDPYPRIWLNICEYLTKKSYMQNFESRVQCKKKQQIINQNFSRKAVISFPITIMSVIIAISFL